MTSTNLILTRETLFRANHPQNCAKGRGAGSVRAGRGAGVIPAHGVAGGKAGVSGTMGSRREKKRNSGAKETSGNRSVKRMCHAAFGSGQVRTMEPTSACLPNCHPGNHISPHPGPKGQCGGMVAQSANGAQPLKNFLKTR